MNTFQTILNFIENQPFCVLSTADSQGNPAGATMAFSILHDEKESNNLAINFSTSKNTEKFKNIEQNDQVAITWGWDKEVFTTVQAKGTARVVTDSDELESIQKAHFKRNPGSEKYKNDPENRYIVLKLYWTKYSDLNDNTNFGIKLS